MREAKLTLTSYIAKKIFADFGKQPLIDARIRFQAESNELVYRLQSGRHEPLKDRETRYEALGRYLFTLGNILNEKMTVTEEPVLM